MITATKRPVLCGRCFREIVMGDTGMPVCISCRRHPSRCDCEPLPKEPRP
jgi:hypothetical protein